MRIKAFRACLLILVSLYLLSNTTSLAYGAGASTGAAVGSVSYAASGGVESLTVYVDSYGSIQSFYLSEPNRYVIDIKGVSLPAGSHSFNVGRGSVTRVRYGMFDTQTARFVLDLSKKANFSLTKGAGFIVAKSGSGAPDTAPIVSIPGSGSTGGGVGSGGGSTGSVGSGIAPGTSSSTSAAQVTTPAPSQRPLRTPRPTHAPASANAPTSAASSTPANAPASAASSTSAPAQSAPKPAATPAPSQMPLRTPRVTRTPRTTPTPSPGLRATPRATPPAGAQPTPGGTGKPAATPSPIVTADEFRLQLNPEFGIVFSTKNGANTCTVNLPKGLAGKAKISGGGASQQITVDVPYSYPGAFSAVKPLNVNSDVIKSIGVTQPDQNNVRITLELRGQVGVETIKDDGKLVFKLTNEFIPNIGYYKNDERAFLSLYQTALTSGGETLENFYESVASNGGKTWTISFDGGLSKIAAGAVRVNDGLLKSVESRKDGAKKKLIITAEVKVSLVIFTKYDDAHRLIETTVSIIRPASGNEKVVVIDAGHGGFDPGAVGISGRYEKDIVLDVAIKLKELLSRQKGLRVYLTRDGDYFVDIYERAMLANELDAALFISIHANASSTNPNACGTETLYCPSSTVAAASTAAAAPTGGRFTSRQFAEMTQKKLVARLKTYNRDIKERPNLVVLRRTKMPAILVETAFVTNADDLLNLSRSAFRKNIANAVADSIMEAIPLL